MQPKKKIPLKLKTEVELPTDHKRTRINLPDGKSWVDVMSELPDSLKMSQETFEKIWDMHPTSYKTSKIMGKTIPNPRWEQPYGHSYKYGGIDHDALPLEDPYLILLLEWAKKDSGLEYQGILINWYEDGQHYIGYHADNEKELVPNSPIYSFTYGQERDFYIKSKKDKAYLEKIWMKNGSLIIMGGEMQKHYKHSVPKRAHNKCPEKRINITIRLFN